MLKKEILYLFQGKVILGEAGKNCKRGINLQVFGMTLTKKGKLLAILIYVVF